MFWKALLLILIAFSLGLFLSACGGVPVTECPVTLPNGSTPPGEISSKNYYGNGQLWTVLRPDGIIRIQQDDLEDAKTNGLKWPWWRSQQATGTLTVNGSEINGNSGSVSANVLPGYGLTGFQVTGLKFPGEGCWEVVGQSGNSELRFVTKVEIISD